MSYDVVIDLSGIERKFSQGSLKGTWAALAEKIRADCDQYVPKSSGGGSLRGNTNIDAGSQTLEYTEDYAKTVYNMDDGGTNWTTPGTHSHWVEHAKGIHMGDWETVVKEALTK